MFPFLGRVADSRPIGALSSGPARRVGAPRRGAQVFVSLAFAAIGMIGALWFFSSPMQADAIEAQARKAVQIEDWRTGELALASLAFVFAGFGLLRRRRRKATGLPEDRAPPAFAQTSVGIIHVGLDARVLRVNQRLCDITGYSREELLNTSVFNLNHPDDRLECEAKFDEVKSGGIRASCNEQLYLTRDGGSVAVSVAITLARGEGDEVDYCIGVIEDLSHREADQADNEELVRFALRLANDGLWDLHFDESLAVREVYYSPRCKTMLGYRDDEIDNDIHEFKRFAAPESLQASKEQIDELRSGARTSYELEIRLRHKDGRWLDILARGLPAYDSRNRLVRLVGTHVDITERKRQEMELRLAGAVFSSSHNGVVVTDPKGSIIMVNPAFRTITGYGDDELDGRHMRIVQSGRHGPDFYKAMYASINATGHWQGEIWNRRKSGEIYPEWLTISSVQDKSGETTHYVGVFTDISKWKQSETQLEFLTHHDALTGLPNRKLLLARIEQAIRRMANRTLSCAVLFIHLDRFKTVNDSLGHAVGDQLLILATERLQNSLRDSDTLARQGGHEFILCIEDVHNGLDVATFGRKLIDEMAKPFILPCESEVLIGLNIGVSLFPHDGDTADLLLQHADSALNDAKSRGGAAIRFYDPTLTREAVDRLRIEAALSRALERGQFALQYQPLLRLHDRRIVGVEALVRWRSPFGLMPPLQFIPVAEETGLIVQLGEWVLREACTRMKAWRDAGLDIDMIAVNLSARQFDCPELCERIRTILDETGLAPELLELEITENALMRQGARAEEKLKILKALGVRIAIDDFGTGYSSLAYLKSFPIDKLKIDRSFISEIPGDPVGMEITSTVVHLAHSLKVKALAEGVETQAQADFLAACGCDLAQGFLFDKPLWEEDLMKRLNQVPGLAKRACD